jgi:uncharacterized protein YjbJ (UPF0337 family)
MAETAHAGRGGTPPGGDGGQVSDQAKGQVQQAAGQATDQARQAAGQARHWARTEVDRRSTVAGEKLGAQASDLRTVGEELRKQGKDGPARMAEQVADRAERVGRYLTESDAERILGDVEDLGRRNPWAVMAGAVVVGFVASRFLKASSRRRYEERVDSPTGRLPAGGLARPGTTVAPGEVRPGVAGDDPSGGRFTPGTDPATRGGTSPAGGA